MIRFLSFLFNKPYEPCKSCETLKEQLEYERAEKKELTQTLLNIIKPKVFEQPTQELKPLGIGAQSWSRKRAILEAEAREKSKILHHSPNVALPDNQAKQSPNITTLKTVEEIEQELGIEEVENQQNG